MGSLVFTIANQKGGVGKTTTAVNLAAALADKKIPVLLVDLDPQANATSALGIEKEEGRSLYGPLHGEGAALDMIVATDVKNLSLIPSEEDLAAAEIELAQTENYLARLRAVLEPVKASGRFRVIIIDCPPSMGMLSMNSLAAADHLLIALQCEYMALEGLGQILRNVERIKEAGVNAALSVGGIVMTMYDIRTNLSRQVVDEVRQHLPDKIFNTVIPRTVRLSEAPSFGKTIFAYDPLSPGASAYKNLAREISARFEIGGAAPARPPAAIEPPAVPPPASAETT
ncbi:ParA family protein [Termitidicoccus mucosus]|uniref:Sporulation initiation inhibitor Soj n=1 Tax=Termitidicoccus mucosus TaxID=1184151 RepID=A0A178IQ34_9BACT|nr:sporulation initiation inhibitor Soj [Opitutaceae bacterium TSB47]